MTVQSSGSARADTSSNASARTGSTAPNQSINTDQARHLQPCRYRPGPAPVTDLPFVGNVKTAPRRTRHSFWKVPAADDYGQACDMGRQYACDLMQYLKDNPCLVGSNTLGLIVRDMAHVSVDDDATGYAVGFWSMVEIILHRAIRAEDHWAIAQQVQDRYDVILAARTREVAAAEQQDHGAHPQ